MAEVSWFVQPEGSQQLLTGSGRGSAELCSLATATGLEEMEWSCVGGGCVGY